MNTSFTRCTIALMAAALIIALTVPELVLAQRRGSFGGSHSSGGSRSSGSSGGGFGGSRSSGGSSSSASGGSHTFSSPSTSASSKGFSSPSTSGGAAVSRSYSTPRSSSFGGNRMQSHEDYTRSYGIPRRTETMRGTGSDGVPRNYVVNHYGGMSDGFMLGYISGQTSMWWHTPFHPAFYYSRPYYVAQPDGTMAVYPPTISWVSVIVTAVVVVGGVYLVYRLVKWRRAKNKPSAGGSFS